MEVVLKWTSINEVGYAHNIKSIGEIRLLLNDCNKSLQDKKVTRSNVMKEGGIQVKFSFFLKGGADSQPVKDHSSPYPRGFLDCQFHKSRHIVSRSAGALKPSSFSARDGSAVKSGTSPRLDRKCQLLVYSNLSKMTQPTSDQSLHICSQTPWLCA